MGYREDQINALSASLGRFTTLVAPKLQRLENVLNSFNNSNYSKITPNDLNRLATAIEEHNQIEREKLDVYKKSLNNGKCDLTYTPRNN